MIYLFRIFRIVGIALLLMVIGISAEGQLLALESVGFEGKVCPALKEVPDSFSFRLVRNFTRLTAGEEKSFRSMVKFYKLKQKWRFELWVGNEGKESLDVIQMYDGKCNYLWYPTTGAIKVATDFNKLDNFPSVFMENFGIFGFLVNRGENPSYVISGAIPCEILNPKIWESSLKDIDLSEDLSRNVRFPLFKGKFGAEQFWYTVQFDRGNLLRPMHISKFSGDSLIGEISTGDENTEERIFDMIPKKVKTLGYDKSGKIILKGDTVFEEWNLNPLIREDLFQVDYSICKEILDLDNLVSIPVPR